MTRKSRFLRIGVLFCILGVVWLAGCSGKPVSENTPDRPAPQETTPSPAPAPPAPAQNSSDKTLTQQEAAEAFVHAQGYTIQVNSGANFDLQLPNSFAEKRNGVQIGEILRERNELSRQNGMDFSSYLGKKISLYTYAVENQAKEFASIDLVMDGDKVVGCWIDKRSPADFNVIVGAYQ